MNGFLKLSLRLRVIFSLASSFFLISCDADYNKLELQYKNDYLSNQPLVDSLFKIGADTINAWTKDELDFTFNFRFNCWEIDSLVILNKKKNRAIGFLCIKDCIYAESSSDYIYYLYYEKIKGDWYLFDGSTMVITRENYQKDIHTPLSFEQLSKIGRTYLLKGYYGYFVLFPFVFWKKEQNFADPFWGSEWSKQEYISRVNRLKERLDGVELYQNQPNPFSSTTEISMLTPPEVTNLELEIYSKDGRKVKTKSIYSTGYVSIKLNATDFKEGEYIYNLNFFANHRHYIQGYKIMSVLKQD